jgi:hypothetical protein
MAGGSRLSGLRGGRLDAGGDETETAWAQLEQLRRTREKMEEFHTRLRRLGEALMDD